METSSLLTLVQTPFHETTAWVESEGVRMVESLSIRRRVEIEKSHRHLGIIYHNVIIYELLLLNNFLWIAGINTMTERKLCFNGGFMEIYGGSLEFYFQHTFIDGKREKLRK